MVAQSELVVGLHLGRLARHQCTLTEAVYILRILHVEVVELWRAETGQLYHHIYERLRDYGDSFDVQIVYLLDLAVVVFAHFLRLNLYHGHEAADQILIIVFEYRRLEVRVDILDVLEESDDYARIWITRIGLHSVTDLLAVRDQV